MYESNYKERVSYVVTLPNWMPMFEWSMVSIMLKMTTVACVTMGLGFRVQ